MCFNTLGINNCDLFAYNKWPIVNSFCNLETTDCFVEYLLVLGSAMKNPNSSLLIATVTF
jgi:hypothetical protein